MFTDLCPLYSEKRGEESLVADYCGALIAERLLRKGYCGKVIAEWSFTERGTLCSNEESVGSVYVWRDSKSENFRGREVMKNSEIKRTFI